MDTQKSLRQLISPLTAVIPTVKPPFGIFHVAIIVGPWLLEWTDSSICIPKSLGEAAALLAIDIANIKITPDTVGVMVDKLANLVVKWNTEYTYCLFRLAGKKSKEGNCQDFVDDVLSTLGISFTPKGPLKDCLETMRTKGKFGFEYRPSPESKAKCDLKENVYTFKSHKELDQLVNQCMSKTNRLWILECFDEFEYLKSLDRGMWLRYLKHK